MLNTIVGVLGAGFLAVFGWAFHLNSAVDVLETKHEDLIVLINTKFDDLSRRLDRIEHKLDGRLPH